LRAAWHARTQSVARPSAATLGKDSSAAVVTGSRRPSRCRRARLTRSRQPEGGRILPLRIAPPSAWPRWGSVCHPDPPPGPRRKGVGKKISDGQDGNVAAARRRLESKHPGPSRAALSRLLGRYPSSQAVHEPETLSGWAVNVTDKDGPPRLHFSRRPKPASH
jgi:hypothetical protein